MKVGDAKVIATALLHDALEDGKGVTLSGLEKEFGSDVASGVKWLSKKPLSPTFTKKDQDEEYHVRIQKAPLDVKRVKIADRLDNIRFLHLSPDKEKIPRYVQDTRENYLPMVKRHFPAFTGNFESILSRLEGQK